MNPALWKMICEECDQFGVDPHQMINRSAQGRAISAARAAAMKRIRRETRLSLPKMAELFHVVPATVWSAIQNEPSQKHLRDGHIQKLWNTMPLTEIAITVGLTEKGVREAGKRLGLPPAAHVEKQEGGHRAFTPRCGEILRAHGVFI